MVDGRPLLGLVLVVQPEVTLDKVLVPDAEALSPYWVNRIPIVGPTYQSHRFGGIGVELSHQARWHAMVVINATWLDVGIACVNTKVKLPWRRVACFGHHVEITGWVAGIVAIAGALGTAWAPAIGLRIKLHAVNRIAGRLQGVRLCLRRFGRRIRCTEIHRLRTDLGSKDTTGHRMVGDAIARQTACAGGT